jgi:hypothetical protein
MNPHASFRSGIGGTPGIVSGIGVLGGLGAVHILLSAPDLIARIATAGLAAAFVLAVLLPRNATACAVAATVLSAAIAIEHVIAPFLSGSENLMRVVGERLVWPNVLQGIVSGWLLASLESRRTAAGVPRSPWAFLASCIAYGTGLVLLMEAGLAALGPATPGSTSAVVLHAFAADTSIHLLLLVLWFGLTLRAAELYLGLSRGTVVAAAAITVAERRQIEALIRLLPMLGFLGTVIGLAGAIGAMSTTMGDGSFGRDSLDALFRSLAVKFETSLLGLAAAIVTGILMSAVDGLQERPLPRND